MRIHYSLLVVLALVGAWVGPVWSAPSQIAVTGFLEDANSSPPTPLEGTYAWEIRFYSRKERVPVEEPPTSDTITTHAFMNQVGGVSTGTVEVRRGVFAVVLDPPEDLLDLTSVWFDL